MSIAFWLTVAVVSTLTACIFINVEPDAQIWVVLGWAMGVAIVGLKEIWEKDE